MGKKKAGFVKEQKEKEKDPEILEVVPPPVKFLKRVGQRVIIQDIKESEKRALLIAGNGVFEYFVTSFGTIIRKIPKERYPEIIESKDLNLERLPYEMYLRALTFLREVDKEHKAEGCICYFYNLETEEYREYVPEQEVSGSSAKGKLPQEMYDNFKKEGFVFAGTIHSHPSFAAFQSGTDFGDEKHIDGWHITVGKLNEKTPAVHCRWSFRGTMFEAELDEIVIMPEEHDIEFPADWLKQIKKPEVKTTVWENQSAGRFPLWEAYHQGYCGKGLHGGEGFVDDYPYGGSNSFSSDETIFLFAGGFYVEELECTVTSD